MAVMSLKVGSTTIEFLQAPRGAKGSVEVKVNGVLSQVTWRRDQDGIWLEFPDRVVGFDFQGEKNDEGRVVFLSQERLSHGVASGMALSRAGDEALGALAKGLKKTAKVKSQMPGKIVKILVKVGDEVASGQSLMVMEAMKMENEIKSHHRAKVTELKVKEGQAVESGAELLMMEPIA